MKEVHTRFNSLDIRRICYSERPKPKNVDKINKMPGESWQKNLCSDTVTVQQS